MTLPTVLAAESHYFHRKCLWNEAPFSKLKINQENILILCLNSDRKTLCSSNLNNKSYVFQSSLHTLTMLNKNSVNFLFYLPRVVSPGMQSSMVVA